MEQYTVSLGVDCFYWSNLLSFCLAFHKNVDLNQDQEYEGL